MGRYISNINTNSYQDNELLRLKQGFAKNRKEFLTAGTTTWTIDHDVIARVRVWGGGGGGGATAVTGAAAGGGGAGGAAEAILRLNAGTYNITVGAGGGGATTTAGAPGKPGGSSSFHTYITCSGGGAGGIGSIQQGGLGGSGSFDLGGFGGFLYIDGRFGGAGGSLVSEFYNVMDSSKASSYQVIRGSERGEGESGGPASYADSTYSGNSMRFSWGGGGGGYNPPFIYGPGRGVGTGGNGRGNRFDGASGQPGAVVIEWN